MTAPPAAGLPVPGSTFLISMLPGLTVALENTPENVVLRRILVRYVRRGRIERSLLRVGLSGSVQGEHTTQEGNSVGWRPWGCQEGRGIADPWAGEGAGGGDVNGRRSGGGRSQSQSHKGGRPPREHSCGQVLGPTAGRPIPVPDRVGIGVSPSSRGRPTRSDVADTSEAFMSCPARFPPRMPHRVTHDNGF